MQILPLGAWTLSPPSPQNVLPTAGFHRESKGFRPKDGFLLFLFRVVLVVLLDSEGNSPPIGYR
jgi:hypothetical protein